MYVYVYIYIYICIYIYIYMYACTYTYTYMLIITVLSLLSERHLFARAGGRLGGGDDTVGNPPRAQISHFELFELRFTNYSFSSLSS